MSGAVQGVQGRRPELQGVRGWAIVLVLLFHFYPTLFPNGYIGVDVFFVLSGFLMTMIVWREESMGCAEAGQFYYRRAKRILPLYLLAILATALATICAFPASFHAVNLSAARRALTLTTNVYTGDENEDYEKKLTAAVDLFTHTWSLCVEMQFYAIAPIIFGLQKVLSPVRPVLFYSAILVVSLAFFIYLDTATAFNFMLARVWQFMVGSLAFTYSFYNVYTAMPSDDCESETLLQDSSYTTVDLANKGTDSEPSYESGRNRLYLSTILAAVAFVPWTIEPLAFRTASTFVAGVLIANSENADFAPLENRFMIYIGNISYALYLVHWPIAVYVISFYKTSNYAPLCGLFISIALSIVVHHLIEKPYLQLQQRTIAVIISLLFISSLIITDESVARRLYLGRTLKMTTSTDKFNIDDALSFNLEWGVQKINLLKHDDCVYSKLIDTDGSSPPFGLCTMPNGTGHLKVLAVGNSYAANHMPLIRDAFRDMVSEIHLYNNPSGSVIYDRNIPLWRAAVERLKPDILFVTSSYCFRAFAMKAELDGKKPVVLDEKVDKYAEELSFYENHTSTHVFILDAEPCGRENFMSVLVEWQNKERKHFHQLPQDLEEKWILYNDEPARKRLSYLAGQCEKCELYDMKPYFMNGTKFQYFDPVTSKVYFENGNHLTSIGLEHLRPLYQQIAHKVRTMYT